MVTNGHHHQSQVVPPGILYIPPRFSAGRKMLYVQCAGIFYHTIAHLKFWSPQIMCDSTRRKIP
jgi:hypothetical protein